MVIAIYSYLKVTLRYYLELIKSFFYKLNKKILFALAENEAIVVKPGEKALWRTLQLNSLQVIHGEKFYIGYGFWISNGKNLILGNRCSLGEFARIMDHSPIQIGDDFIAATGLQINSGTHDPETMEPILPGIKIGHRVWCGANVTIVAGASIGDDVVIGACSLVRSHIPSGSIAVGVPAKVIRSISRSDKLWTWI
ncbi:MAG: hypothetical protein DCE90_01120 [Pseudanabaena sp.]|nr:MAG: hypothetical protein DCE90_01120 [Pseudanabaena sp.]